MSSVTSNPTVLSSRLAVREPECRPGRRQARMVSEYPPSWLAVSSEGCSLQAPTLARRPVEHDVIKSDKTYRLKARKASWAAILEKAS